MRSPARARRLTSSMGRWVHGSRMGPSMGSRMSTAQERPVCCDHWRVWAPRSVGAIDPVGMTKGSMTKARNMNATTSATITTMIVCLAVSSG